MRNWCAALGISALLTLPVGAQQKSNDQGGEANATETPAEKNASVTTVASGGTSLVVPRNVFALPAAPMPEAFPGPAAETKEARVAGKLVPRYEVAGMYDYVNFSPGGPLASFNNHGGSGSFTYNASRWLGLTGELGGYNFGRNLFPLTGVNSQVSGGFMSYLFGPRLNLRKFDHFVPFGEFLVGGTHGGLQVTGDKAQSAFAVATGGGLDIVLLENLVWRFAQLDYFMTNFSGPGLGGGSRQNNFRAASGVVVRFGLPHPAAPPPLNHPPAAACSLSPASVYAGSGNPVAVHVNASDPDNDPLTYSYTATGGVVEGSGPEARWNSSGVSVGTYTVNVKVDDGKGGTASCAADLRVDEKPNRPPIISCATERSPVMPGERTGILATASDPDGDPLTYSYTPSGGQIVGTGPKVEFDSTGLQPGSYKVKCSVSDGRGGAADASTNVDLQQPPPPPQPAKVGDCGYAKPGASRFDNACKRVGDDVALRLKSDPNAKLVIVGFADPKEPNAAKLSVARAELAKKYLGEKGIDASRISTRPGSASGEKGMEKENRRVDFIFVPEGATY
jgi:outer membrane protein OmpA-like peptidoglycan-associated protein